MKYVSLWLSIVSMYMRQLQLQYQKRPYTFLFGKLKLFIAELKYKYLIVGISLTRHIGSLYHVMSRFSSFSGQPKTDDQAYSVVIGPF